jgi:DNA-directed RNA polymerase subunit omega
MLPAITMDCQRAVPNRFALVLLAAARIRALMRGDAPRVPQNADPPLQVALREIAAGVIDSTWLRRELGRRGEDEESAAVGQAAHVGRLPAGVTAAAAAIQLLPGQGA